MRVRPPFNRNKVNKHIHPLINAARALTLGTSRVVASSIAGLSRLVKPRLRNPVITPKVVISKSDAMRQTLAKAKEAAERNPGAKATGECSAPVMVQASDFEIADRIISIRLDPAVGVINMRVYKTLKVVKRDLIVHEPRLRAMMKGRRFNFPDAVFDPKSDLEDVKDETVYLAENLINAVGKGKVKAVKPPKDTVKVLPKVSTKDVVAAPSPTAVVQRAAPAQGTPAPKQHPAPASKREQPRAPATQAQAPESKVFAPKPAVGFTYVGTLREAGSRKVTPRGRDAYEVFTAIIQMDNGAEFPLRGAELERELELADCQLGDRISITPMGKVPVTLTNGGEGKKNLYKVQNLQEKA